MRVLLANQDTCLTNRGRPGRGPLGPRGHVGHRLPGSRLDVLFSSSQPGATVLRTFEVRSTRTRTNKIQAFCRRRPPSPTNACGPLPYPSSQGPLATAATAATGNLVYSRTVDACLFLASLDSATRRVIPSFMPSLLCMRGKGLALLDTRFRQDTAVGTLPLEKLLVVP